MGSSPPPAPRPFVTICLDVCAAGGGTAPAGTTTHVFELELEAFAGLRARLEGIRKEMSLA